MTTYWLSLHAAYRCRDTGACCGAGWPIPVEAATRGGIDAAVAAGRLAPVHVGASWLESRPAAPPGIAGTFARTASGACVFHRGPGAGCAVHATLGHGALPAACQHFPRVCLVDRRGAHVTLSHFCPTAADLLFTYAAAVRIVEGPPAVPERAVPEGLDVRDALPPLLTARCLTDLEGYAAWERHAVEVLAGAGAAGATAEAVAARLRRDAAALARWRPGRRTLAEAVSELPAGDVAGDEGEDRLAARHARAVRVAACCPPEWAWLPWPADLGEADAALVAPVWRAHAPVVRRFLAAHAFASWAAWQGVGPRSVAGAVGLALDVLRTEAARAAAAAGRRLDAALLRHAVRQADLLLRHHADRQALADLASRAFAPAGTKD